jgi:hypothetical protein
MPVGVEVDGIQVWARAYTGRNGQAQVRPTVANNDFAATAAGGAGK